VAAIVLLLLSPTDAPPVGAGAERVTVTVELFPPTMEVGLRVRFEIDWALALADAGRLNAISMRILGCISLSVLA
jgi:hypothetical protein